MVRLARSEVFAHDEVAIVHVMNRVVRRCFLLGDDPVSGKNFDHRKGWIEEQLKQQARHFGIDLLGFAVLSNHFHLILRSRPDVVQTWNDTEVARRWLMLCPLRRDDDGSPAEPNEYELNSIRHDKDHVAVIRSRLSDISWWMRLLSQRIAMRANHEDGEIGKFWQSRYKAVRILDDEALLACAAYVDLNPIRAALAEKLEDSDHTSVQRRIQAIGKGRKRSLQSADDFLSPLQLSEPSEALPPAAGHRCSDRGFLTLSVAEYIQLLDCTAREIRRGKRGSTPRDLPPVFERLNLQPDAWFALVRNFGRLFRTVAGRPESVDNTRGRIGKRRFHISGEARQLLTTAS